MTANLDLKDPKYIPERYDTYRHWLDEQNVPIFEGFYIEDVNEIELAYWDLKGVPVCFVILEGTGGTNDAYICEIPPGGYTKLQRHMYEEMIYITKGYGATSVWQRDAKKKHTFEWGPGSLFAIPLNADYQHFNGGREPVRYYAVTNNSFMMNLFHSVDFIFNNDYVFSDRFDPSTENYFGREGELFGRFFLSTNFVTDIRDLELADYSERGKGSTNMKFDLAGNAMGSHVSEFPVGTYKKCHRHGPGAHVIIVNGQGYSLLWPDGEKPRRVDWKPGSVVVPPNMWWHQHFNTGAHPARYLALRWNNWRYKSVMSNSGQSGATYTSVKLGGNQIEFEDEDATIMEDFLAEIEKSDVECKMKDYHPYFTGKKASGTE